MKCKVPVFLLLLCWNCIQAQDVQYTHYTPKNGLVNSRVRKAYQDSRGRMYFLTFSGLSVYDGVRFKNYTTSNGLSVGLVNDVLEIGEDSILIAPNTNKTHLLTRGTLQEFAKPSPIINYFLHSEDGNIYASADDGLFILRKNKFEELPLQLPESIHKQPFLGAISEYGKYLIIASNDLKLFQGLFLYDREKRLIVDSLNVSTYLISKGSDGKIWAAIYDEIVEIDRNDILNQKLTLRKLSAELPFNRPGPKIITSDLSANYIVHSSKTLHTWNDEGQILKKIDLPKIPGLSSVHYVYPDREGSIWICLDAGGVIKLGDEKLKIFETFPGKSSSMPFYFVFNRHDSSWLSTNTDTLCLITNNTITNFGTGLKQAPGIFHQEGNTLYAWMGSTIMKAEIPGNRTRSINFKPIFNVPSKEPIWNPILLNKDDYYFVSSKDCLYVLKDGNVVFRLPHENTNAIVSLHHVDSFLYITYRFANIQKYRVNQRSPGNLLELVKRFDFERTHESPRAVKIDKQGRFWVGTRYDGLFLFDLSGDSLKTLGRWQTKDGLSDNFVTSVDIDKHENVIVGSTSGIDILVNQGRNYRIENVTKTSNVFIHISNVFYLPGKIMAISNTGNLVEILDETAKRNQYSPRLFVEELKVNGEIIDVHSTRFDHEHNNLSFSLAAPTFIDEKQVQFSYFLDGAVNAKWSDTSFTNATINLINLPSGDYALRVKAFFPSTTYHPLEIVHPFTILTPWWQTWWFRLLMALTLVGIVALLVRLYYLRKMERNRLILEYQKGIEKERTRIATDMHDDLGSGLSRIKFLSDTITLKKHHDTPIDDDVGKIREYSQEMLGKMNEIVWALNEKNDSLIDLLSYTRSYAADYLAQNNIDCEFDLPADLNAGFVKGEFRRNIFLSVKEALHNIVKHSGATKVVIEVMVSDMLQIVIMDNGRGFDQHNTRPFSNGLSNIRKRLYDLGGTTVIDSENGTRLVLQAPI